MKTKPKTKAKPANQISDVCDIGECKPRRSIPLAEVHKMIEAEVRRVKSQRTIFDDRNDLLSEIRQLSGNIEYHDNLVHTFQKELQTAQSHLKEINTAIKRELELGE